MKKRLLLFSILLVTIFSLQAQQGFNYQSVLRDDIGEVLSNTAVSIQFQIRETTVTGTVVYTETHSVTTTPFGLINVVIGQGTSTDDFSLISWGSAPHFLEVGIDTTNSGVYSSLGTTQFLSVPYAQHAETSADNLWTTKGIDIHPKDLTQNLIVGDSIKEYSGVGQERKLFFDTNKAAFRAGAISTTGWDDANVGFYSFATGSSSTAAGDYGIAMGEFSSANGEQSIAIGHFNNANAERSFILGTDNTTNGIGSFAAGVNNTTQNELSAAIGFGNSALGRNSMALGWDSRVESLAHNSLAMGVEANASGQTSFSIGYQTLASQFASIAIGYQSQAIAEGSTAIGYQTTASGLLAIAAGHNLTASGFNAVAVGVSSSATNTESYAVGYENEASGEHAFAFGRRSTATGEKSFAAGVNVDAIGDRSSAFGFRTKATSYGETTMGIYATEGTPINASAYNALDRLFVIGNGTDISNRSDALSILKNGTITINEAFTLPNTDGTANQVLATDGAGTVSWVDASTLVGGGTTRSNSTDTFSEETNKIIKETLGLDARDLTQEQLILVLIQKISTQEQHIETLSKTQKRIEKLEAALAKLMN